MHKPIAIVDSGPLIALARIGYLTLLPQLFSKVIVPPEVWKEVTVKGRGLPEADMVSKIKWFIFQFPDPILLKPLKILVDAGEAEVIALAHSIPDSTLLLDDSHARKVAKRLNLKHIGTVGLLLRAKKNGLIENIKPSLKSLPEMGIYLRKELIDAGLKAANE